MFTKRCVSNWIPIVYNSQSVKSQNPKRCKFLKFDLLQSRIRGMPEANYRGDFCQRQAPVHFDRSQLLGSHRACICSCITSLGQRTSGAYLYTSRRRGYRFEMISDNVKGVRRHVRDGFVTKVRLLCRLRSPTYSRRST